MFTGHDTKVMRNAAGAKYKFSSLEWKMNMAIGLILVTQIILSIIAGLVGAAWTLHNSSSLSTSLGCSEFSAAQMPGWCNLERAYYLALGEGVATESGFPFSQKLGTWILIFTNFVPISLMVTKEVVALNQGMFMSYDVAMYDEEQDMEMRP